MSDKYILEIYSPDSVEDVEVVFESDTPFMAINVGDILNSRMWETTTITGGVLKVVKLEHFIWKGQGIVKHKIGVMTEFVKDIKEERFR